MAAIRNENGLTPFQIALIKLSEAAAAKPDFKAIPATNQFIKFLLIDCQSDPNASILRETTDDKQARYFSAEFPRASAKTGSVTVLRPISLLLSQQHADLVAELIEASRHADSAASIDFTGSFNEKGLSPLLQACADRQSKIVSKIVESGVLSAEELCRHRSVQAVGEKNAADESILQVAVRYGQIELFETCVNYLIRKEAGVEEVVKLLKHVNVNKQNFVSMLTFMSSEDRQGFSSTRLAEVLRRLAEFFKRGNPAFDFSMFILELVGAKDRLDRSTLHTALINFHMHISTSIDLEMFLLDQIFTIAATTGTHTDAYKQLKTKFFCTKDVFGRLPIHYLFYDSKHHQTNDINEANIYTIKNLWQKLSKNKSVYFGRPTSPQASSRLIDPVEILTVLIKQMDTNPGRLQFLDEQDLAGFTPLHYAAIRGATIACTLLINAGCSIFKADNQGNTPLSSCIYFKRSTTALTLLRSLTTPTEQDKKNSLKAYYHYHEKDLNDELDTAETGADTENSGDQLEPDLKWHSGVEKALHAAKRIPLYTCILLNEWEGVSWLVLGELASYGLNQFDALQAACTAKEFNLAIRLLEKFLRETSDPEFRVKLCSHVCDETSERTLLHLIAGLELTASVGESLGKFLSLLFASSSTGTEEKFPDIAAVKLLDKLGASAMHYACHMHNFAFVDFMVDHFAERSLELLTCKDAAGQTPYALLFWQIGRVEYKQATKEKLKHYTTSVVRRNEAGNFAFISRAYFPVVDTFLTVARREGLLLDYPPVKREQLICPLIYAINREDFDMVKFLLKELEFNVNSCESGSNKSALVYAIERNNIRLCKLLLNVDFEGEVDNAGLDRAKAAAAERSKKMGGRIKGLLGRSGEDSEDLSEDEENNDESINNDEALNEVKAPEDFVPSRFEVKSNIVLNQLDNKQRSVFHHLACSLHYGSFHNVEICRLLFAAFNSINSSRSSTAASPGVANHRGLPSLVDFLKRVDSQQLTASDHALRNGNLSLYEELQKCLNPLKPVGDDLVLEKFTIDDKLYDSSKRTDYASDSASFLAKSLVENLDDKVKTADNDCFRVDPLSNMSNTGAVVWDEKSKTPYDVVMTKTDVTYGLYGMHNFYKMQLISLKGLSKSEESVNGSANKKDVSNGESKFDPSQMCVLFTRWGRIGDQGQYQRTPFSTFKEARDEFCKVFKQKTANDFVDTVLEKKKPFENKPKRYILIKLDSRRRQKLRDVEFEVFTDSDKPAVFRESLFKHSRDYMHFFGDLLSVEYVKKQIQNSQLSTDYIPITRLSLETIENASDILKKQLQPAIERRMELEKLNKKENLHEYMSLLDQINKLSNQFYDLIPQMDYNYEKLPPISTEKELDEQIGTINRLTNSQIAVRMLMAARMCLDRMNPFDYVYRSLNVKLELLDTGKPEAQYVLAYIPSRFHVKRVFKFERAAEVERFDRTKLSSGGVKQRNRWLLWHGTGAENMLSIMSKGLVKAPTDVAHNGNRFGKGIYFSDSFEASSAYSSGVEVKTEKGSIERRYMLLCEVALGNVKELQTHYETVDSLPAGYDSVKALGKKEPNPSGNIYMPNGVVCPLGEAVDRSGKNVMWTSLTNSQYVVYNESQVVIRYIVQYYE